MSLGGLFGSDQSTSSTSTNTINTPSWLLPTAQSENTLMQGILNTPYQQYQGQQVAQFNGDQQSAFNTINGIQGQYQGNMNTANGIQNQVANTGLNGYSQQQLQGYMNPYTQNVINTSQQQNLQNYTQQQQALQAQQAQIGAFGGSRSAIAQQQLQNNFNLNQNAQNAQQYQSAFGNAQNQAYLGTRTAASAGQALAQNASTGQSLGLAGAQDQLAAGTQEQQLAQQNLNVPMAQFQSQLQYPYQQLNGVQGGIQGLLQAENGSTTNSQSTTTGGPGILGAALGVGSMLSGMGGFGGLASGFGSGMGSSLMGPGWSTGASAFAGGSANVFDSLALTPFKDGGLVKGYDQGGLVDPFGLLRSNRIATNRIERGYKNASNPDKSARGARAMGGFGINQRGDDDSSRMTNTGFAHGGLVAAIDHFHNHMSHQTAFDQGVKHGMNFKGSKKGYASGGQVQAPQASAMNVSWFQNPTVSPMQKAQAAIQALNGGSKNPAQTAAAEDWMSDPQNKQMVQQYSQMKQSGLAGAPGPGYNAGGMVHSASPDDTDPYLDSPMRGSINPKVDFDNDGKGSNPDPSPSTEEEKRAFQGLRGYDAGGEVGGEAYTSYMAHPNWSDTTGYDDGGGVSAPDGSSLADAALWSNLGKNISSGLSSFANDTYPSVGQGYLGALKGMENAPYTENTPGTTNFQNIGNQIGNLGTATERGLGHLLNAGPNAVDAITDWGNSPVAQAHAVAAKEAGLADPLAEHDQAMSVANAKAGISNNTGPAYEGTPAQEGFAKTLDQINNGSAGNLPTGGSKSKPTASKAASLTDGTDVGGTPTNPPLYSQYAPKAGQVNTPLIAFGAALLGSKNNFFHSLGAAGSAYVDAKQTEQKNAIDALREKAYEHQEDAADAMRPYSIMLKEAQARKAMQGTTPEANAYKLAYQARMKNQLPGQPVDYDAIADDAQHLLGGQKGPTGGVAGTQTPQTWTNPKTGKTFNVSDLEGAGQQPDIVGDSQAASILGQNARQ